MSKKDEAFEFFDAGKTTDDEELKALKLAPSSLKNYYRIWREAHPSETEPVAGMKADLIPTWLQEYEKEETPEPVKQITKPVPVLTIASLKPGATFKTNGQDFRLVSVGSQGARTVSLEWTRDGKAQIEKQVVNMPLNTERG